MILPSVLELELLLKFNLQRLFMIHLKKKSLLLIALMSFTSIANALEYLDWQTIREKAQKEGIDQKIVSHAQCFFEEYEFTKFNKKKFESSPQIQCSNNNEIELKNKRVFALIDYTTPSNQQRMFLIDRVTGAISHMAVAHGRYEAGFMNLLVRKNKNSIKNAKYFSNELGSNAPSSGYFIAGNEYYGKFGRSLVLHGLESGINDNACQRAVVIHKHKMMSLKNAYVLSSGCPMVSEKILDHVIDLLKTRTDDYGSLVFIYGPREKAWARNTCRGEFNL